MLSCESSSQMFEKVLSSGSIIFLLSIKLFLKTTPLYFASRVIEAVIKSSHAVLLFPNSLTKWCGSINLSSRNFIKTSLSIVLCVASVSSSLVKWALFFLNDFASAVLISSSSSRNDSSIDWKPPLKSPRWTALPRGFGKFSAYFSIELSKTDSREKR